MIAPDFDPTVFIAALAAGPMLTVMVFWGWLLHRAELDTGEEPKGYLRLVLALQLFGWPVIYLSYKSWFFWNFMCVFMGIFMSVSGTFLALRWLYLRILAR